MNESLKCKYRQKFIDATKKPVTNALNIISKIKFQKAAEATSIPVGIRIAGKFTSAVSQKPLT